MKKKNSGHLTIMFWVVIIFFLDPGGFLDIYFGSNLGKLVTSYGFLMVAYICFIKHKKFSKYPIFRNKYIHYYNITIIIWYTYYFIWFYMINNPTFPGLIKVFLRNSRELSQGLLVVPIAYFTITNLQPFIRLTTKVTIVVLALLFFSILSSTQIVKLLVVDRGFVEVNRYFMYGNGLIYFSLTIAIGLIVLDLFKNNKILISGLFTLIFIIITYTRRSLIGVFEYIIIITFLVSLINRENYFKRFRLLLKSRYVVILILVSFYFMLANVNFYKNLTEFTTETLNTILYQETTQGTEDHRMSMFSNVAIVNAIKENFWAGTGFDPDWGTGDGGGKGYEGSDYIFLSCFAMYGLIGLLTFLPFYLIAISIIRNGVLLIRRNYQAFTEIKFELSPYVLIFIASSSEMIKNIIEYPNWFYPIGFLGGTQQYFIFMGLLIGSFIAIQQKINQYSLLKNEN